MRATKTRIFPEPNVGFLGSIYQNSYIPLGRKYDNSFLQFPLQNGNAGMIQFDDDYDSGLSMVKSLIKHGRMYPNVDSIIVDYSEDNFLLNLDRSWKKNRYKEWHKWSGSDVSPHSLIRQSLSYVNSLNDLLRENKLFYASSKRFDLLIIAVNQELMSNVDFCNGLIEVIEKSVAVRFNVALVSKGFVSVPEDLRKVLDVEVFMGPGVKSAAYAYIMDLEISPESESMVTTGIAIDKKATDFQVFQISDAKFRHNEKHLNKHKIKQYKIDEYQDFLDSLVSE